ncbi:Rhomboid-like protein 19 [Porphyridium purpureum]|uniref:Rhomboid-like protein 19 n=1 Tax=Porphyridium purpureum TaxID=35688 RepID=A0A5J4Z5R3_PORPP|nr:Rhomboid-like protein 19 [Porphyridium purpureum]|eukprot:POR8350..scf295_1
MTMEWHTTSVSRLRSSCSANRQGGVDRKWVISLPGACVLGGKESPCEEMDAATVDARGRSPSEELRAFVVSTVSNVPSGTRVALASLFVGYLLASLPILGTAIIKIFALIPSNTFSKMMLWNVLTHCLIESSFISFVLTSVALLSIGRWVEPLWGAREMALFSAFTQATAGFMACFGLFFMYFVTTIPEFLFLPHYGALPLVAAFGVAVKQLGAELQFISIGPFQVQARYLPLLYIGTNAVLCSFQLIPVGAFLLVFDATLTAWFYLRFLQSSGNGATRGDASGSLAVHTFFPEPLSSFVETLTKAAERLATPTLSRYSRVAVSGGSGRLGGDAAGADSGSLPAAHKPQDGMDVDRRRSLALKSLEERMTHEISASSQDGTEDNV